MNYYHPKILYWDTVKQQLTNMLIETPIISVFNEIIGREKKLFAEKYKSSWIEKETTIKMLILNELVISFVLFKLCVEI